MGADRPAQSEKAVEGKGPVFQAVHFNQHGVAAFGHGAFLEAVDLFTQAYALLQTPPDAAGEAKAIFLSSHKRQLAVTLTNRCRAHLSAGSTDAAEKDAKEAMQLDASYTKAKTYLAEVYQKQGRSKEAEALLATLQKKESPLEEEEDKAVKFERLPLILQAASRRALQVYTLMLLAVLMLLWLHRRPTVEALRGAEEALDVHGLQQTLRYSAGFGLSSSLSVRLLPAQHAEEASRTPGFSQVRAEEWQQFFSKSVGRSSSTESSRRLMLLSWQKDGDRAATKSGKGDRRKSEMGPGWVGMLAWVNKQVKPATAAQTIMTKHVHGRLIRLGRSARSWLQKKTVLGLSSSAEDGGLLPLVLEVHGSVAEDAMLLSSFACVRAWLAVTIVIILLLLLEIYKAARAMRDFRRHPAFLALAEVPGAAREIEADLQEELPFMAPLSWDNGKVTLTLNWFIHCAGNLAFLQRLVSPFFELLGAASPQGEQDQADGRAGVDSSKGPGPVPGWKLILKRCLSVLMNLPVWLRLLRRSVPGTVLISPLIQTELNFRQLSAGKAPQAQLLLIDQQRYNLAAYTGLLEDAKSLAEEAMALKVVNQKVITALNEAEGGATLPPMVEGGVDPRTMTLPRCYEALNLTREELRAAEDKEAAKERLARAFRLVVLKDKKAAREKIEVAALAFDMLVRRVCLSLEL
eukprot:TRINITY_DN6683_c0_g1_i1.p1 TRINITY_DN6683_c0_g1~~TRINITY_DN6683_c0_g1_i1.p1  ORF type:complete len:690 (-),score=177.45 TRINITY_DN6683_c0_g1_i1:34-2103(-)